MSNFEENENYSQMKNNIIGQSSRIAEILTHGGKFKTYYEELMNNVVESMNAQIRSYVENSKKAILYDIYDGVVGNIDFSELKDKFKADMKKKGNVSVPKYEKVNMDLDGYDIGEYETDVLVNMYSNMDEKTVKKFAKYQDEALSNLSNVIDDVTDFESNLCSFRNKAIEKMKNNVDLLYAIHVNYAKAVMNKNKNIPECVSIGGKQVKLSKSQKEFITNGLKVLIGI